MGVLHQLFPSIRPTVPLNRRIAFAFCYASTNIGGTLLNAVCGSLAAQRISSNTCPSPHANCTATPDLRLAPSIHLPTGWCSSDRHAQLACATEQPSGVRPVRSVHRP